ncbi:MAG: hypoxanthine phosphoribosyltransferase [Lachnospiraceae bacterium]|jgi:hypoxanthine phosphoribosyltransferase|nr:hypoxanthine phosphoribosyltransferase [Lachnospiraceae bacterium]MCI1398233.1 hypoxanthine phosphoribosyltransferase [Lachnospiraceae bacterium]MCI1423080.1 hypoxanthine phosphoribosyltransferase [Lachnospiraceae bacterium]MCI1451939.1 hypoxanthine phosphoribosyltransferase [Lachnospiraceae bacterium]MDD5849825.1 hypoxanthine phosphoribosyltransferase [Bacillota bacterium]
MAETITTLISQDKIEKRITEMAEQISKDYAGRELRMVGILKGACFFLCELAKQVTVPVSIDFMQASSYGGATESTGTVRIRKDLDESIEGVDVMIVEDIVDSGRTLAFLGEFLKNKGAKSITYCTLLDKPQRRVVDLHADYSGFEIPDEFVVGYGMDYAEKYRNLPYIGVVHLDKDGRTS